MYSYNIMFFVLKSVIHMSFVLKSVMHILFFDLLYLYHYFYNFFGVVLLPYIALTMMFKYSIVCEHMNTLPT